MAAEVEEGAAAAAEEIKPYKIHVSSRYLDLTKQKLEVTRLPHEHDEPRSTDWWQPKSHVEPLIDFWLEQYSWREEEDLLNLLPQFRTGFTIPSSEAPIRIHFIHIRSPHANAVPLLLIPPFPFSNLSFGHLIKPFTDPEDAESNQPFHLVIPSLPGLGFSDALPNNTAVISSIADIMDSLMKRLSYSYYLVTNASAGAASPAEIDYKLASYLSTHYTDSCLGTHFISPPLAQPKLMETPVEWAKWSIARFFQAPVLGYRSEDFSALKRSGYVRRSKKPTSPVQFGLNRLGLTEPNTFAYALCDSPTGLLVFVMKGLRLLGPRREFTPTEVINFTQLAWLPGPESAMRLWAHCVQHQETIGKKTASRPKIGVTVFLGDEQEAPQEAPQEEGEGAEIEITKEEEGIHSYACPSWAKARSKVLYVNRAPGKAGLLAWERPEIIAAGVRGLATAILKPDDRLRPSTAQPVAILEEVVTDNDAALERPASSAPVERSPALLVPPPRLGERGLPHREHSDDTAVGSDENLAVKTPSPGFATPSPVHLGPSSSPVGQQPQQNVDDENTST
ncbi:Uu.00g091980.m01.CDS01 [Anthostomella pinea]|uniref:Uu.00g091980.m01.CDS01 n=1 Tax=Anthostomella pinea TaxID=933095 RepID=A0AAI8YKF9_9PEZI|nr:Uu.00g091980.m01.CDS01 [Anthostomella pinea]